MNDHDFNPDNHPQDEWYTLDDEGRRCKTARILMEQDWDAAQKAFINREINFDQYNALVETAKKRLRDLGHGYNTNQQIVVTEDYCWCHNLKTGERSYHRKGEIHTVNHDNHPSRVWTHHNGYSSTLLRRFTRPATPQDAGYVMTHEEWVNYHKPVSKRRYYFLCFVSAYLFITAVMMWSAS